MGLWTSSSRIACIFVWFGVSAAPQLRRGRRGLFTKPASVDVWAFALRLFLRCQLPQGSQHFFGTTVQRNVCSGARQARHRHARLGLCRLGRFGRNPPQLKVSREKEKLSERLKVITYRSSRATLLAASSDHPSPVVADFPRWSQMIQPCGTKSCMTTWKRCYFVQFFWWKKEPGEVRRRKRTENKWRRETCQETGSQKQKLQVLRGRKRNF